ncbi:MAG: hypothetical protein ACO3ND_03335 [Opitutales bacterium]
MFIESVAAAGTTFELSLARHAESLFGQESGSAGLWLAVLMAAVYLPFLGRQASRHFFGVEASLPGLAAAGILSVGLTFTVVCMADSSLTGLVPAGLHTLAVSLCTGVAILLITSASAQALSMGFGPSLGLQLVFWNIVLVARLATSFLTDFWTHL